MQIKQIDPTILHLRPKKQFKLGFKKTVYIKTQYGRTPIEKYHSMIDRRGYCLAGLLPKISRLYPQATIETVNLPKIPTTPPKLKTIKLMSEQLKIIQSAIDLKRGIIQAPTGYGKTAAIAAGIISCFKSNTKILFVAHTISLCKQTVKDFKKELLDKTVTLFCGIEKDLRGNVVVGTVQSLCKLSAEILCDFDVILVDEGHHASKLHGHYHKMMMKSLAPFRFLLTATPHTNGGEEELVEIGLFGELIGKISLEEGMQAGRLATPRVKLKNIPYCKKLQGLKTYKDIRSEAIINNSERNRIIVKTCIKDLKDGKSCLIYVNSIAHGEKLKELFKIFKIQEIVFVQGSTNVEERERYRVLMNEKNEAQAVIATTVWKEGINIPSLDCIYIVDDTKSEIALLQTIGRGLRRTESKTELIIRDFIDVGKYISEHAIERISLYIENGWL